MRHRILLAASLFYLCAANIIWIAIDTRPPFWDMAGHARPGHWASYATSSRMESQQSCTLPQDSGSYPPLYYAVTAVFYGYSAQSIDAAQLANTPAIILLGCRDLWNRTVPNGTRQPPCLPPCSPISFRSCSGSLAKPLSSTGSPRWLRSQSGRFSRRRSSPIRNGRWSSELCCGLGMLTKWTFVIFVGSAGVLGCAQESRAMPSRPPRSLPSSLSYWYVPQFATMPKFWRQVAIAGQNEHDPAQFSHPGLALLHSRARRISPVSSAICRLSCGLFVVVRNWRISFPKWTPLVLCLLGSWFGLMLLPNEDPRYAAASLPVVAIFAAAAFEKRRAAQIVLTALSAVPACPGVVWNSATARARRSDERHWTGLSHSIGISTRRPTLVCGEIRNARTGTSSACFSASRPGTAHSPARVGMIPDLPRFDVPAFQFSIDLHRYPVVIDRQFSAGTKRI